ncbi:MAG TPA: S-layer homology domain-containing protein [Firmicutes bacterium]|nr:S-layer homology domain-containing protein [Candidatus Fermentithermobacillaceae bacterium]
MSTRRYHKHTHLLILTALTFIICLSLARSMPAKTAPIFQDVRGHWAEPYISTMVDKGILTGYPDGSFKPDETSAEKNSPRCWPGQWEPPHPEGNSILPTYLRKGGLSRA